MVASQKSTKTNRVTKKIQDDDLLELWKYFQDRADMLKERQWTVGTWILTVLSGNIAFSLSQETLAITQAGIVISKPLPALLLGIVGILLCGYGFYVIRNYGQHIQRNWDRAGRVKQNITDLDFYWKEGLCNPEPTRRNLPDESRYLIVIIVGFLILHLGMSMIAALAFV